MLIEDELSGVIIGSLTVMGRIDQPGPKTYTVKCSVCSNDQELFDEGLFGIGKTQLLSGGVPCGCAKFSARWSEAQYITRVNRTCGGSFIGWAGGFTGSKSMCLILCPAHGEHSVRLDTVLRGSSSCKMCVSGRLVKPDEHYITKFTELGDYCDGTKFTKSTRVNSVGSLVYWHVYCPVCKDTFEATASNLYRGTLPCHCSKHNQRFAYINTALDGAEIVALKFGISATPDSRKKKQDRDSIYSIEPYGLWEFSTRHDCRKAELVCKKLLQTGVLTREEMKDGWTETTYPSNIDDIIKIYENHGAVRIF
jgi:hypothetical protein